MVIFHSYVNVYQRVDRFSDRPIPLIWDDPHVFQDFFLGMAKLSACDMLPDQANELIKDTESCWAFHIPHSRMMMNDVYLPVIFLIPKRFDQSPRAETNGCGQVHERLYLDAYERQVRC